MPKLTSIGKMGTTGAIHSSSGRMSGLKWSNAPMGRSMPGRSSWMRVDMETGTAMDRMVALVTATMEGPVVMAVRAVVAQAIMVQAASFKEINSFMRH